MCHQEVLQFLARPFSLWARHWQGAAFPQASEFNSFTCWKEPQQAKYSLYLIRKAPGLTLVKTEHTASRVIPSNMLTGHASKCKWGGGVASFLCRKYLLFTLFFHSKHTLSYTHSNWENPFNPKIAAFIQMISTMSGELYQAPSHSILLWFSAVGYISCIFLSECSQSDCSALW